MKYLKKMVSSSKYNIKCPYSMKPEYITFHNTDNNAPAVNEATYMVGNNNQVSFHYVVDDKFCYQCIPENRNAWAAGDGKNGTGNRKSIHVEIAYNKLGANNSIFKQAEENAVIVCGDLLKKYGLGIDKLKPHKSWSGKNCPSTTNHANFIEKVKKYINGSHGPSTSAGQSSTTTLFKNGDYNCKAKVVSSDGSLTVRDKRPVGNTLGKKLGEYKTGDIIEVGYCKDGWFGVIFNGKQGFISGNYVELIKTSTPSSSFPYKNGDYDCKAEIVGVGSAGLLVRDKRPVNGVKGNKIGSYKEGQVVTVGYCKDNWFGVSYNGKQGFIYGEYVKLIK